MDVQYEKKIRNSVDYLLLLLWSWAWYECDIFETDTYCTYDAGVPALYLTYIQLDT